MKNAPILSFVLVVIGWALCSYFIGERVKFAEQAQSSAEERYLLAEEGKKFCVEALKAEKEKEQLLLEARCPSAKQLRALRDLALEHAQLKTKNEILELQLKAAAAKQCYLMIPVSNESPKTLLEKIKDW